MPRVTVLLLTYEDGARGTAERTLRAVQQGIAYEGSLHLHIADDGSQDGHVARLREIAGATTVWETIGATNAARGGYGRSYNLATQAIHSVDHAGIVMPLEDDWELLRPLDITPLVLTLTRDYGRGGADQSEIDCIRLGYLGFTQPLHGNVVHTADGPMLLIDSDSPEPHVFAGHPRLETVAFERRVGPWPEGLAAGATEFDVAHRAAARRGIAWPLNRGSASQGGGAIFAHIGAHGLGELQP